MRQFAKQVVALRKITEDGHQESRLSLLNLCHDLKFTAVGCKQLLVITVSQDAFRLQIEMLFLLRAFYTTAIVKLTYSYEVPT